MPKISELPAGSALAGTELAPVVQSAVTVEVPVSYFTTLALAGFSANGLSLGAAADYAAMRALLDLEAGTDFNAYSTNLAGLSALGSTGLIARTGAGTYAGRELIAPAAGITVTNGDGVSGNPTLVLANDLAALEALSGTDTIYYRSGVSTWSAVTISTGLSFSGGTLTATGSGGTVTASGSPSSGFLAKWTSATDITKTDLTGDVTTSGGVATTIANSAVTLAKIANASANSKLLGSGAAGSGAAYAELSLGTGLSFTGTTLNINVATALGYTPLKAGKVSYPIAAASMTARTTSGAAAGTSESTTNKVMLTTFDFDASTDEFTQILVPMPKNWDEGTVTAQFYWTASNTGNVVWGAQGVALSDDDAVDTAFGTAQTVTDGVTAAGDVMISAETSAITIAGSPAAGDLVIFQFYRDADNGSDTCTVDAKLIAVKLFITLDASDEA